MVLSQNELYFYYDLDSKVHYRVVILTPGVFVQQANAVNVGKGDQEFTKAWPLEIFVGGSTLGNVGIHANKCLDPGLITIFFQK